MRSPSNALAMEARGRNGDHNSAHWPQPFGLKRGIAPFDETTKAILNIGSGHCDQALYFIVF